MKKFLLIAALLSVISTNINAQEQPKQLTFTVTPEELQVIGAALEDAPFKKAAPIIQKLQQQVQQQLKPEAKPKPEEKK